MHTQTGPKIPHYGAFESTKIHGSGTDILATTRHTERWEHDLDLLRHAGIRDLRYSVPWHRIEQQRGEFDFSWLDGPMEHMRRNGMDPVVDLLHHTSFPDWLENGFANPEFPEFYTRFVQKFLQRYEWVSRYTVFNEPFATTMLCTSIGAWYPHHRSDRGFVEMALNVGRAICLTEEAVRRADSKNQSVYIDTCEHHQALDRRSRKWVERVNDRRFCILDLVLGRLDRQHPMYPFFIANGMNEDDPGWFSDNRTQPDILGLDYYAHSEINWFWNRTADRPEIARPVHSPRGFSEVAMDYVDRYHLPVVLAETNIRGTIFDRLTWLRFMEEQTCTLLDKGVDIRGFCWYPSIDSTDWGNLCAKCTHSVDPQGIWYLDEQENRWTRYGSELSDWFSRLARGTAEHHELPAYRFLPPLDRDLAGYSRLMSHWEDWVEAPDARKAA